MSKVGPVNAPRLKSIVERIERMEEERKAIAGDIRDIYSEAKGVGYDVKTLRKVVAARKMDEADREEQETLFETYMRALGHNVERAVRAVHSGAMSIREAEEATGVKRSTIHRAVPKEGRTAKAGTPEHDPATGEVLPAQPGPVSPGGTERSVLERLIEQGNVRVGGMSDAEREAHFAEQRASWVRGEMGMGSDADEAAYREQLHAGSLVTTGPRSPLAGPEGEVGPAPVSDTDESCGSPDMPERARVKREGKDQPRPLDTGMVTEPAFGAVPPLQAGVAPGPHDSPMPEGESSPPNILTDDEAVAAMLESGRRWKNAIGLASGRRG